MLLKAFPNFLSLLRIVLSPIIPILVANKAYIISFLLIVLLAITDFLDGFIARTLKAETTLGKFLDPVGDKVFTFFALISYTFFSGIKLPLYLFIFLLLRDVVLITGGAYLKKFGFIPEPSVFGKLTTFFVSLALGVVALLNVYYIKILEKLIVFLSPLILFLIWVSFLHYLYKGYLFMKEYIKS